ncbi:hypothetical protein JCM10449v2_004168 [Rhodotorula kratochvilovae]
MSDLDLLGARAECFEGWHGFPAGSASCSVTAYAAASLTLPDWFTILPAAEGGHRNPVTVLLIKHEPTGRLALFDLGIKSNWKDDVPANVLPEFEMFDVHVEADLVDVLAGKGIQPSDISTVVLSHHHFDHIGDPTQFPSSQIIVGPDTKHKIRALDAHAHVTELAWDASSAPVATFERSFDVWGDGSLVLVDASGHTSGHLAALIRTGVDEYVLAAADCCHHPALLVPKEGEEHLRLGKWRKDGEPADEPPRHANYDDYPLSEATLERVKALARREDVRVVLAHDFGLWEAWGKERMAHEGVDLTGWREKELKVQ